MFDKPRLVATPAPGCARSNAPSRESPSLSSLQETMVMAFDNPLASEIWSGKYRFNPASGAGDATLEGTWSRVAAALAEAEVPGLRAPMRERFAAALQDHRFLPAGRILAGGQEAVVLQS